MFTDKVIDTDLRCPETLSMKQAGLCRLLAETSGRSDVCIALIDGIVNRFHPALAHAAVVQTVTNLDEDASPGASAHASFIASMLVGEGPGVLGICRGCTLVSIPVAGLQFERGRLAAHDVAAQIAERIRQALQFCPAVIQLSLDFAPESSRPFAPLVQMIGLAARSGVRTVISAGNRGSLGSSQVLHAPGVIPVAMAGADTLPAASTTLGIAIGSRGLLAPGTNIPGAAIPTGGCVKTGTSFSATFVTATFALLLSRFRDVHPDIVWNALLVAHRRPRSLASIVPPLLDADASLRSLQLATGRMN